MPGLIPVNQQVYSNIHMSIKSSNVSWNETLNFLLYKRRIKIVINFNFFLWILTHISDAAVYFTVVLLNNINIAFTGGSWKVYTLYPCWFLYQMFLCYFLLLLIIVLHQKVKYCGILVTRCVHRYCFLKK